VVVAPRRTHSESSDVVVLLRERVGDRAVGMSSGRWRRARERLRRRTALRLLRLLLVPLVVLVQLLHLGGVVEAGAELAGLVEEDETDVVLLTALPVSDLRREKTGSDRKFKNPSLFEK